jgi:hypothetical protein
LTKIEIKTQIRNIDLEVSVIYLIGYRTGAGAQEENLFRRTNYFQVLGDPDEINDSNYCEREWAYPLPEFCGLDFGVHFPTKFQGFKVSKFDVSKFEV